MSLGQDIYMNSFQSADDMLTVQEIHDKLQSSVYELYKLCTDFNFKLLCIKINMVFCEKSEVH